MPSNDFSGLQAARANLLKIASQAPEREVSKIPGMLAGYAKDYEAKARQEKLDALAADERAYQRDMDAKQDAITKEKMGWLRDEQEVQKAERQKLLENEAAQSALLNRVAGIPDTVTSTQDKLVNEADIRKATKDLETYRNKERELGTTLQAQDEAILDAMDKENQALLNVKEVSTPARLSPGVLKKTTVNEQGMEDPKGNYQGYVDNTGKEVPGWKRLLGDYETLPEDVILPERSKYYEPASTKIVGRDEALKASQKVAELENAQKILERTSLGPVPKIPAPVKKTIASTENISRSEYMGKLSKEILEAKKVSPKDRLELLSKVEDLTEAKYGPALKQPTIANILAAERLKLAQDKAKLDSAKDIAKDKEKVAKNAKELSKAKMANTNTLKALDEMYSQYGDPDVVGSGDRSDIEQGIATIKGKYGLTDSQMESLINQSRGTYNSALIGVDEKGFLGKVEKLAKALK
jgi:hypothetical protein